LPDARTPARACVNQGERQWAVSNAIGIRQTDSVNGVGRIAMKDRLRPVSWGAQVRTTANPAKSYRLGIVHPVKIPRSKVEKTSRRWRDLSFRLLFIRGEARGQAGAVGRGVQIRAVELHQCSGDLASLWFSSYHRSGAARASDEATRPTVGCAPYGSEMRVEHRRQRARSAKPVIAPAEFRFELTRDKGARPLPPCATQRRSAAVTDEPSH